MSAHGAYNMVPAGTGKTFPLAKNEAHRVTFGRNGGSQGDDASTDPVPDGLVERSQTTAQDEADRLGWPDDGQRR